MIEFKDNNTITGIYDKDIDLLELKSKPILKPILEINKSYINFELIINRALTDFNQLTEDLKKMQDINPKYSELIIMNKFNNILTNVKEIIHSQDIQKRNMIDAIKEMINISQSEYGLLTQEYVDALNEKLENSRREKKEVTNKDFDIPEMPKIDTSKYTSEIISETSQGGTNG